MSGRLLLRPDAYRARVRDGVYLLSYQGQVHLTGAAIGDLLDRLAPYLDGQHSLTDLTAALSPERRALVERIITTLQDRGMVRVRQAPEPDAGAGAAAGANPGAVPLSGGEQAEYQPEIGFVGYFRDAAIARFARYRAGTGLVIGAGPLVPALARAACFSGLRTVRVVTIGVPPPSPPAPRRDQGQRCTWRHLPRPTRAALASCLSGVDVVWHAATEQEPERIRQVEQGCSRAGVPLAQAIVTGAEVWLLPAREEVSRAAQAAGPISWTAIQPRLAAARRRVATAEPPDATAEPPEQAVSAAAVPAATPATLVASQLVQQTFRRLTGTEPVTDSTVVALVDLRTLRTERHLLLPYPTAEPAATTRTREEFAAAVEARGAGARITEHDFSQRAVRCVDPRLGLLGIDEHDWTHGPLFVSQTSVTDPLGLRGQQAPPLTATAASFSYQSARCQAVLRGLARYASLLVRPDQPPSGTWGWELIGGDAGRVRTVPAAAAFPALRQPDPPEAATAGIAGGYDWPEAVRAGLLGQCRRLTLDEFDRTCAPRPAVDVTGTGLDPTGERCRALLVELGRMPEVRDATGSLGVPTLLFCLDGTVVAATAGPTAAEALTEGLLQTLWLVQAHIHDQPEYAPRPVPVEPPPVREGPAVTPAEIPGVAIDTLVRRLRASGHTPVVVPLDHDPAVAAIAPYLLHVVIHDE